MASKIPSQENIPVGGAKPTPPEANVAPPAGGGKSAPKKSAKMTDPTDVNEVPEMSSHEKERITEVFKMYETDVRSAAMHPRVSRIELFMKKINLVNIRKLMNSHEYR